MLVEIASIHCNRSSHAEADETISPELNARLLVAIFGPVAKAIVDRHVYADSQGQRIDGFPKGHWARVSSEIRTILLNNDRPKSIA